MKKVPQKKFLLSLLLFVTFSTPLNVFADDLNYNPALEPPAPVLDAGWAYDQIDAVATNSLDSSYDYSLLNPAWFRITDYFSTGDTFFVYDFGSLVLTTTPTGFASGFGDNTFADAGWTSPSYGSAEILLAVGPHSLTVQGDGAGGLPAGFYTRLDHGPVSTGSVPEPTTIFLLSSGLIGLVASRKKLKE